MRIAFIVNGFPLLSETFILNQITGLLDRGHDVHIFPHTRWNEPKVHPDVAKYNLLDRTHYLSVDPSIAKARPSALRKAVYLILKNLHKKPSVLWKIVKLFKGANLPEGCGRLYSIAVLLDRGPYDVVHSHFGSNGNLAVALKDAGAFDAKIVTTFHGHDLTKHVAERGKDLYADLFRKGDLFCSISRLFKDKLTELGCDERKVIVHRAGVDTGRFEYRPRTRKTGPVRLLTIARLVEIKGIEYAIQAVADAMKRGQDLQYKIAGDGPLKSSLQSLLEKLGVGDKIELLGWQDQEGVIGLLRDSDILLAPSVTGGDGNQEGIPVVLMEALAQGIPVIATRHSGIPELVRDGEAGFLVPERDPDALAEKLEYLIEHPERWSGMGRKGRGHVEEHFNIDKLNDRLVEIYRELAARERRVSASIAPATVME
jgi:colanic acid/amylovoran biosynthesis glycosyltransferase